MADEVPTRNDGSINLPALAQPDIMNDAEFNPPQPTRRDTMSSKASEGDSERTDTCRICRSEGTPDEPLFYPCKCSGSIKFVHQECLMEWLSHSHKKHCELCKTPFRFTKLYDANMPQTLPWDVFVRRACWHIVMTVVRGCRTTLVGFVWLALIPWLIRWVWRWLFWIADAAWARDAFIQMMAPSPEPVTDPPCNTKGIAHAFQQFLPTMSTDFRHRFFGDPSLGSSNITASVRSFAWPQADPSVLSSWTYLACLTPSDRLNRLILDVFEGQLITCVVITGFILVFLIREWVVQQQPLVNLDNVQQQLREAADRVQADNERLRRQQELLDQARMRLVELQNETDATSVEFLGWDALESLIDNATVHLRKGGETERAQFLSCAATVTKQIRAAGTAGESLDEFSDKVYQKLASYSEEERNEWQGVLLMEIEKAGSSQQRQEEGSGLQDGQPDAVATLAEGSDGRLRRPPMPGRDLSSRATEVQRLLAEAEDVFNANRRQARGSETERLVARAEEDINASRQEAAFAQLEQTEATNEDASIGSAPPTESWQEVTPPNGSSADDAPPPIDWSHIAIPITNAGPDAKTNIKWSGTSNARGLAEIKIMEKMLEVDEKLLKLKEEVAKEAKEEQETSSTPPPSQPQQEEQEQNFAGNNPFHPDGPEPEHRDDDSFGSRVASVFREEFGLNEAEELEHLHQLGLNADGEPLPEEPQRPESPQRQPNINPPTRWERLTDWFWGDIRAPTVLEPVPAVGEERQDEGEHNNEQVAPFVPVQDDQPAVNGPEPADAEPEQPQHDPEVVAAAQQAGLDPEAIEDAEDLEGIFELIGLQGPMIGLFQTSAFCLLLVACTVLGAVIVPYFGGKMILSIADSPIYFLLQLPLQVTIFIADFLIDITLMVTGALVIVAAFASGFAHSAVQTWAPSIGDPIGPEMIIVHCTRTIEDSANHFQNLFPAAAAADNWAWGWTFLRWSMHAHSSLRAIEDEINSILHHAGAAITWTVETVSSGSVLAACNEAFGRLMDLPTVSASISAEMDWLKDSAKPLLRVLAGLMRGTLTISTSESPMDPSLVYWNSTDRALAILTGYGALAALAAIYVAADTPITKSESGRKTEKIIRDTLRQAGGVLKVILIISIEMLLFPLYCGLLLDVAFLPLFRDANVASRWAFAGRKPYTFCFVHWFVGTCYMFHFALFVGMCRKILRKGVLWFIRDPDDPTFHPVRDVLERNVATQLRKIAFSALVYGALVILCLGGVIWTIGHLFDEIFPIHWVSTEPVLEFPMDMLLYNFVTPIIIRLVKPSDAVNTMYAWWLRKCARGLRLSHFLFDDRRRDEEGHFVHRSWSSFFLMKKPSLSGIAVTEEILLIEDKTQEVYFSRDGKYNLTPCNDQYRPPKAGEAYFQLDESDAYIMDKDGKKNDHFAKIYIPPLFRIRIALFMICLWIFSAFVGLLSTIVPLILGRSLLTLFMPEGLRVSDIYAYSLGAYIVGGVVYTALKARSSAVYIKEKAVSVDLRAWVEPVKLFSLKALKCLYVYGFLGVALPTIFALFLQFYLILPLHTWAASVAETATSDTQSANLTSSVANLTQFYEFNSTQSNGGQLGSLTEHSFHVLQDYTLGLLYVRVFSRMVIAAPASRAAEAFRRVTADGYLNPNIRLATRFFVLPATMLAAMVLLVPPLLANLTLALLSTFMPAAVVTEDVQTKLYRYSYPIAASIIVVIFGAAELSKATSRWRMRIRDEAYLVGERLHNFGEKKPPPGSKSVVRKER